jgi:hypothetical protein
MKKSRCEKLRSFLGKGKMFQGTNAGGECPKGECASTNALRANVLWTIALCANASRMSLTILTTQF